MPNPSLLDIQDSLLAVVRGSTTLGQYCQSIEPYEGGLTPETLAIAAQLYRYPACLLVYQGSTPSTQANKSITITETHALLLLDENRQGIQQALRGDAQSRNVGTYRMVVDARQLLIGNRLSRTDIAPLTYGGDVSVLATETFSAYQALFLTWYAYRIGV
jgi:phage gp37-like protein